MELKDFITDNKLIIPEEEIDNIYIWHKVSMTQKFLLSSEVYFKMLEKSFEQEILPRITVLKKQNARFRQANYQFSDFLTFFANQSKIFSNDFCFALTTNFDAMFALICYICHTTSLYQIAFADLSELLMSYVDGKDMFSDLMHSKILCLEAYNPMPEHKWRSAIFNSVISQRSNMGLYTVVCTLQKNFVIGNDLMSEERLRQIGYIDITPICAALKVRKTQNYKSLMSLWYSMLKDTSSLVYSKTEPEVRVKTISRYE